MDIDSSIPKIKFWGEVFQSVQPYYNMQATDKKETFFLEELFDSKIPPLEFSKYPYRSSYQPLLSVKNKPNLKGKDLDKRDVKEYVIISSDVGVEGLSYIVEVDKNSQPVMVVANTMSGDFIQDSENWIKMKTGFFYSPVKKDILFSKNKL